MFRNEEIRKHVAAAICALLFSSTCLLSAVGPVRAAEINARAGSDAGQARATAVMPLA